MSDPPADVHLTVTDDGAGVLLDTTAGRFYALNRTGVTVWNLLHTGHTVEQITAAIAEDTGGDRERVAADTRTLLTDLEHHQLLRSTP